MAQLERIVHPEDSMDSVNQLIQESFGRKYSGNFLIWGFEGRLKRADRLALIGHRKFLGGIRSNLCLGHDKIIGRFESPDGSVLRVLPKYAEQAKKYSETYKTRFGKEPRVILDSKAINLIDDGKYSFPL